jgi:phage FluMu protein Com
MKEQFKILQEMQTDGYNVVTCGNCGDVILMDFFDEDKMEVDINYIEEVKCPHCKETMEYCDMPDLYTQ